jgi:hypothetical protein
MGRDAIRHLEIEIRDMINSPRAGARLRSKIHGWLQLCSALDVVGDSEMALAAYESQKAEKLGTGELYLLHYGVLQTLFVQQDALEHIAEALGIPYTPHTRLDEIRETRHNSVGHPTRRGRRPGKAFNFISRHSLRWAGFELHTVRPDEQQETIFSTVSVAQVVHEQSELVEAALKEFLVVMKNRERDHREKFRSEKLVGLFHLCSYWFEKLHDEIHGSRALGLGTAHVESIRKVLANYEEKLREREELPAIDDVHAYHAAPVRHALRRLEEYFNGNPMKLEQQDAEAFSDVAQLHVEGLQGIAKEIDDDYAVDP